MPTLAESGLPGYNVERWYGLFAPASTPERIVKILHDSVSAMLNDPRKELAYRYDPLGDIIFKPQSQEKFAKFAQTNVAMWAEVGVKETGAVG